MYLRLIGKGLRGCEHEVKVTRYVFAAETHPGRERANAGEKNEPGLS
jgi:hypothetical protein